MAYDEVSFWEGGRGGLYYRRRGGLGSSLCGGTGVIAKLGWQLPFLSALTRRSWIWVWVDERVEAPSYPGGHAVAHATDYSSCSSMGDDGLPPTPRHGLSVTRERG